MLSSSDTEAWPFPFMKRVGECAPFGAVSGGGVFMIVMGGKGRSSERVRVGRWLVELVGGEGVLGARVGGVRVAKQRDARVTDAKSS